MTGNALRTFLRMTEFFFWGGGIPSIETEQQITLIIGLNSVAPHAAWRLEAAGSPRLT